MAGEQSIIVDPAFVANPDEVDFEDGSDYIADSFSDISTASLASSIYEYRYENGRRYHAYKDGKYAIPNDQAEQERLDIIHHIYLLLYKGELHMSPIGPTPEKILDVGTGTGIWAMDMAERYPSAKVIGTDLSPIQPSYVPNVQFQIDDAECEWTFGEDVFDLVHIRHLNGGIHDWNTLLKEAYKATKPGGWIEVAEYEVRLVSDDGSLGEESPLWRYYDLVNKAACSIGRYFWMAAEMGPLIEGVGFKDVNHVQMKLPFGTWPADVRQKEMGAYLLLTSSSAFEAYGYALLTRGLGMNFKEVEELVKATKIDAKSRKIHSYCPQHIYWAQKPLNDGGPTSPG